MGNTWGATLPSLLATATASSWSLNLAGVGGATVATGAASIVSILAAAPAGDYSYVLVNYGANDVNSLPAQATWQADLGTILDTAHTSMPRANIYVMLPWRRGFDASCDTLATWIGNVVATRSPWAHIGPDERIWLKGADDGATNTVDGTHYSVAGHTAAAAQWKTALGY